MADKKFTLLELHLADGSIRLGQSSPGTEADAAEPDADAADGDDGGYCPGRSVGKLLLVVLVIAVLALGIKTLLGGGDDLDELEDLADLDGDDA